MKAYRNVAGEVREIQIDLDLHGNPILPPDTTVDPRPEPLEGHYVTVVGRSWVQIEIPVQVVSFETKKQQKLALIAGYTKKYLDLPVEIEGVKFDADEQARNRLTQALVIHSTFGQVPPAWVAYDNTPKPLASIDDLKAISSALHQAFQSRFFECDTLRQAALAAADEAALEAVVVPQLQSDSLLG